MNQQKLAMSLVKKTEKIEKIEQKIQENILTQARILSDTALLERIEKAAAAAISVFENDGKILLCGNGGSAADAQHIAAELSGRFYKDRKALYAEALHVNGSYLTAVANDYGFEQIYARMIQAAGRKGDILIAISTSGNSPNVLRAIETARQQNMFIIGMTGENGGEMHSLCDILLNIPSSDTPRIQEAHILIGHILCELIEEGMF